MRAIFGQGAREVAGSAGAAAGIVSTGGSIARSIGSSRPLSGIDLSNAASGVHSEGEHKSIAPEYVDDQGSITVGDPGCGGDEDCISEETKSAKVPENRLNHVFQPRHRMEPLVNSYGTRERAFRAIERAAQRAFDEGKLNVTAGGIVKETRVVVSGIDVDILGGRIVKGRVELTNASRMLVP